MPINLAGGYAAGGVKDALLEIVKQRMLEQELAQREEENQFQRLRANRQDTAQEARDKAAETQRTVENARQAKLDEVNIADKQRQAMEGLPFSELVDPATQGLNAKATPAVGLPPLPGTNVMGVSPPEVRQGKVRTIKMGDQEVRPQTREELDQLENNKMLRNIAERQASVTPKAPPDVGSFEDYVLRTYGKNPTPEQIIKARNDFDTNKPQPAQPQLIYDKEGGLHAYRFGAGGVSEIPMPSGLSGKANPVTAQMQNRADFAKKVESHIPSILNLMDQASAQGLLGPVAGRFNEFLAGKIGSTGDPNKDELLNQLRTEVSFLKSGMGVVHSGARGAAVQMLNRFDSILDTGKMSEAELRGAIHGYQNWLQTYGNEMGTGETKTPAGGEATDPQAALDAILKANKPGGGRAGGPGQTTGAGRGGGR
jgi:hypothetical protein